MSRAWPSLDSPLLPFSGAVNEVPTRVITLGPRGDDFAADGPKKVDGEGGEGAEEEEAGEGRQLAAEQAVLAQWQRMRAALRVG